VNALAPVSLGKRPYRFSRDEYLRLGDLGMFAGKRVELIDGEIVEMAAQKNRHAQGVQALLDALTTLYGSKYWVRSQMSLDLDPHGIPDPDIAVIRGNWRSHAPEAIPSTALLVAEVGDSTLVDDQTYMMSLYAAAGIREYWVLNLVDEQLEIHRDPAPDPSQKFGHGYASITTHLPGDRVSTLLLPYETFDVADLIV